MDGVVTGWRDEALCKGTPIDWWFPTGIAETGRAPAIATQYCAACPVWAECRAYALEHEQYGVWAATSMRERDRIRRRQHIQVVTPGVPWHAMPGPSDEQLAAIESEERTAV